MNTPSRRAPSIRSRLTLLVMACIVPAALMAVMLISYDYHLARTELIRSAEMSARATASEVDKEFAQVESTLLALSTSPSLGYLEFGDFYQQAQRSLRHMKVLNIVLEDAAGKQDFNTLRPYGTILPPQGASSPLRRVGENRERVITNLFFGRVSQRPVVALGIPVELGGIRPHVLSASMAAQNFTDLLIQRHFPANWVVAIIDRDGVIVARTHEMEKYVGKKAVPDVLQRLTPFQEGAFDSATREGTPVLAVLSRAPTSGWAVAVGIPAKTLSTELNQKFLWLIAGTVLLLGSGLLLAWRISDRISRAIGGLVQPALALGAGEAVAAPGFGLLEADEVGAALARASASHLQARHRANHDMLTGLANRSMFGDVLEQQLALCQRNQSTLSVLYIDLDDFKRVNDEHGHAVGDLLLQETARRLTSALRKSDIAARLGGDEFAIVLIDTPSGEAEAVAAKLADSLRQPYQCGALQLSPGASIGVAGYPEAGGSSAALLCHADEAMYRQKSHKKAGQTEARQSAEAGIGTGAPR